MLKLGPHTVEVKGFGTVKFEIEISKKGKSRPIQLILIEALAKTVQEEVKRLLAFTK